MRHPMSCQSKVVLTPLAVVNTAKARSADSEPSRRPLQIVTIHSSDLTALRADKSRTTSASSTFTNGDLNHSLATAIQSSMTVRQSPDLRDAVNFQASSTAPVHRWFRYREGFSPAILDKLNAQQRVFDPFCGCGTTLIEARRRGLSAIGTDINPLAVLVAQVKTRDYSPQDAFQFEGWANRTTQHTDTWPAPPMHLLPKLFQPEALNELLRLRMGLEQCENSKLRDLLFVCWLNILEKCSNVFKEGNGLKYRNKRRRLVKYDTVADEVWIPRYFGPSIRDFVRRRWQEQCSAVIEDLSRLSRYSLTGIEIQERSCLDPELIENMAECDASVFSPPYANRFDYFEAFKIELWMGNFVSDPCEMQVLRTRSMRNNLTVQTGTTQKRDPLEALLDLMDETSSSVRMGIRDTLRGYFDDFDALARNLYSVLKPGGQVSCVVGNSAYAGVLIPTDLLCGLIFREAGFHLESIDIARPLHVSSQQRRKMAPNLEPLMRESVITCIR